jgi:hypothetical protein
MSTFTHNGGIDDGILGTTTSHDKNGVLGRNDDTTARNAAKPEGNGVFGVTQVPDGAGVFGLHNTGGVGVAGFGHPAGIGVVGASVPANAKGGDGVLGVSNSEHRNGVVGRNDSTTPRAAVDPGGNGVFGFTQVPDGAGVFGAHANTGVGVAGLGLIGVSGGSVNGVGVMGVSAPPGAKGGDGVQGITNSEIRNGIYGLNLSTTARPNSDPAGNGVLGFTQVPNGAGILGAHGANGSGVVGTGRTGVIGTGGFGVIGQGNIIAVWGQAKSSGWAGYFTGPVRVDGNVEVGGALTVEGDVNVGGDVLLTNRDVAECFSVSGPCDSAPGSVMVIADNGGVEPCRHSYDKRALGVVSGAGSLRPAITLGADAGIDGTAPIALVGTVFCRVDASYSVVEAGDLLTSSETPGHAMKATDPQRCLGAVIGKALAGLSSGCGLVPMIVALQ